MRVHPAIAALRSDRAPQRHAQAAMKQACDSWFHQYDVAFALEQFRQFGRGAHLEDCPALVEIFTGLGRAERMMRSLVQHFCAALAEQPLGHPPFCHGFDGRASTLLLAKSGRAQDWLDQYRFDVEKDEISGVISPGCSEIFLRVAVGLGGEEARDLAEEFAKNYVSDRMRLAALDAQAGVLDVAARDSLWRRAEGYGSRLIAGEATRRRAELAEA